jgi:hypothetical protein
VLALDLIGLLVGVGGVGSNLLVNPEAVVVESRPQMVLLLFLHLVGFWVNLVVFSWVGPVDLAVSKVVSFSLLGRGLDRAVSSSVSSMNIRVQMVFLSVFILKVVNIQRLFLNRSIVRVVSLLQYRRFQLVLF